MQATWSKVRAGLGWGVVICLTILTGVGKGDDSGGPTNEDQIARGRELFLRVWQPNDPRSSGGDGLGPAYNQKSCIACHNLGGIGGGGGIDKNVDTLSWQMRGATPPTTDDDLIPTRKTRAVAVRPPNTPAGAIAIHSGLRDAQTTILHRYATVNGYSRWRDQTMRGLSSQARRDNIFFADRGLLIENFPTTRRSATGIIEATLRRSLKDPTISVNVDNAIVSRTQRNTTPLFGLGLIESIPREVLLDEARRQARISPETAGQLPLLADGQVGRLGWQGQIASLEEFVLSACAVEVGLEVPGHHQSSLPGPKRDEPKGLDMNEEECDALVAFVRALPRPIERPSLAERSKTVALGKHVFERIGCAACHKPDLGEVQGLYSDLLIHDIEPAQFVAVETTPYYGVSIPKIETFRSPGLTVSAGTKGWRTPPLWGVRDSAPYMHDGRARTLEQAIAAHDGQANQSVQMYFNLATADRERVMTFLNGLVSPKSKETDVASR